MSNKEFRKPANPDYQPAVDTSTSADPADVPMGGGHGWPDLRLVMSGLEPPGAKRQPLSDNEVYSMLDDCDRFLWQVVGITSRVLETVDIGEVRRLVAADVALPGAVVLPDGTLHTSRTVADAPAKSRGRTHPLVALLRLAVQAVRLLKQLTSGTHPEVHNRRRRSAEEESTLQVDKVLNAVFKKNGLGGT
jgi:hypothetical protein